MVRLLTWRLRVPESVLRGAPGELAGFVRPSPRGLQIGFISFGPSKSGGAAWASGEGGPVSPHTGGSSEGPAAVYHLAQANQLPPSAGSPASVRVTGAASGSGRETESASALGWGSREGGSSCESDLPTREASPLTFWNVHNPPPSADFQARALAPGQGGLRCSGRVQRGSGLSRMRPPQQEFINEREDNPNGHRSPKAPKKTIYKCRVLHPGQVPNLKYRRGRE